MFEFTSVSPEFSGGVICLIVEINKETYDTVLVPRYMYSFKSELQKVLEKNGATLDSLPKHAVIE